MENILSIVGYFLIWTLILYWIHRCTHNLHILTKYHRAHHLYIKNNHTKWSWTNIFFYMDNFKSSVDVLLTEVLPTLIFCLLFGTWWIMVFYWVWAAFFQEIFEHKKDLNLPILTSGKWHMIHHAKPNKNYGLFIPVWDMVFGTYQAVNKNLPKLDK